MLNVATQKNIIVHGVGGEYPFFMVPVSRLQEVRKVLEAEGVVHHVDDRSISLNKGPFKTTVTLDHPPDAGRVQNILDSLP